jgi:hypothetical protein
VFLSVLLALVGCGVPSVTNITNVYVLPEPDTGGDDGMVPPLDANTTPDALAVDVLGDDGNVWWIGVSAEQLEALNAPFGEGGGWGPDGVYDVGEDTRFADTLLVANPDGDCADFAKTSVRLVGQSTGVAWTPSTIPNFRLDSDDYTEGQRFGGVEHIRLNSGQVGSLFGEASSLATFRALGVPAARASYAWVGGSGWEDTDVLVPMVAREMYKGDFCEQNADLLGGGCVNVREGVGDVNTPGAWSSFECDYGDCDDTTGLDALAQAILDNTGGEAFDESTEAWLDWEAFRRSSCVHWLLWVGDDYVHNTNNLVIAEGKDGKFRFLPYSTDITAGYAWDGAYRDTPLWGWASLSAGCRADTGCREAMFDTCEAVIDGFEALDPVSVIDDLAVRLRGTPAPWGEAYPDGMWRAPDEDAYAHYRAFYEGRAASARAELEVLRAGGGDTGDTGGWDTGGWLEQTEESERQGR